MAKVTSKYQVTVPKKIAEEYHTRPGDDIGWQPAGEVIRVIPPNRQTVAQDRELQLRLFDQATDRHRKRRPASSKETPATEDGEERISTGVAALVDANIPVYRFGGRFPGKQKIAISILRRGILQDSVRLPHRAIIEIRRGRNAPHYPRTG